MHRSLTVLASTALVLSASLAAQAGPASFGGFERGTAAAPAAAKAGKAGKGPKINGGGRSINNNTMGLACTPELVNQLNVNARATSDGVEEVFDPFGVLATVYEARGHVHLKTITTTVPPQTLAQVKGDVVCMANLGPAGGVDGVGNCDDGADPMADVWEVRFQVTDVKGTDLPDDPVFASLFVQDGGQDDWTDESFAGATAFEPSCLQNPFFGLERHFSGNIVVHD